MEQQVPFGQWVSSLSSKQITDELIRPYDKNGNGVLEAGELQALLQETFSLKVTYHYCYYHYYYYYYDYYYYCYVYQDYYY